MKLTSYRLIAVACAIAFSTANLAHSEEKEYQTFSLTAEAGTTGLGGSLGLRLSDHLGIRVGGHFFDYDYEPNIENEDYDVNLKLQSIPVGVDIFTSKKGSFRITLGALLNNKFDIVGTTPLRPVDVNGTTYNSALRLTIEREAVAPFITFGGTMYFNDDKNIGLSFEGGVAYMGKADVALTSTAGDPLNPADVAAEVEEVQDFADALKFYPIFRIGFTVSF